MGIDARDVGILIWKILRISTNTVYTYVRKYPIISGVSTFIFLLYTFLPRLFFFLLYSSPFIACSVFYLRNHLNSKPLNIQSIKNEPEGGTKKADLQHQRSVRRNARRRVEEVGKDWDSSQASEDERDKVILTTLYGEIPNTKKSPKLQKFKKDRGFLVSEDFSFEPSLEDETAPSTSTAENVSVIDPSEMLMSGGGETEIECSSSSEGEGEEEETSRENKKLVSWTEDDQKNLMDLGNSEMERNKRLEHLITRRRTRRLFLLAAEKSLMDMEVPSICIGRNYFGLDRENYMIDGLEMPESAPSVLLPTKNPFDLPYDPQEEKPNLLGDSFQQEFSEPNPNDIVFCHHESFGRRMFPSEFQLDANLEPWRKSVHDWPRPQQDDQLVEEKPSLTEGEEETREEANEMESEHVTEIVMSDSNSLISTEGNVVVKRNGVGNSLVGLVPRNTGSLSSSLTAERQIYMEHFGYSTMKGHKVTQSVESDLQVEFSEIGSPPVTVDGNNSSDDEKSLIINGLNTEKETGFSGEGNEVEKKSIADQIAESQMLPVEKFDQDFIASPETDAAKQFEATIPHTDEVISRKEEELVQNSVNEMNISHDSDEAEISARRTNQESAQEMQEHVEAQVSDVNQVASHESTTSPRSVLPDLSLPLDHTYTLTSENSEVTSVSELPALESSQTHQVGGDRNIIETEEQYEANEEAAEEASLQMPLSL